MDCVIIWFIWHESISLNYVAMWLRVRASTWAERRGRSRGELNSWLSDLRLLRINGEEKWRDSRVFTLGASLRQAAGVFTSSLILHLVSSVFNIEWNPIFQCSCNSRLCYIDMSRSVVTSIVDTSGTTAYFKVLLTQIVIDIYFEKSQLKTFLESHTLIN